MEKDLLCVSCGLVPGEEREQESEAAEHPSRVRAGAGPAALYPLRESAGYSAARLKVNMWTLDRDSG